MNELRLPNFIIAGAPRSATTWLYQIADDHPDVAMAQPRSPEPKFFLVDERYEKGLNYYSETWFAALPNGRVYGEKSTNYLESPKACERIARDLPSVKLIFMLRDPVERAYSNYLWSMRNGLEAESFARALELEDERERNVAPGLQYARPHAYFSRGLYAQLLRPWFERFPREQVLTLHFEDVVAAPDEVARTFHRFLGVTERPDLAERLGVVNAAREDGSPPIDQATRDMLALRYQGPNDELIQLLGEQREPRR